MENRSLTMANSMAAVEMMGTVNAHHQLQLDGVLPVSGPVRVRILVLYPVSDKSDNWDEWSEEEWLQAATRNPSFAFLSDPREDIYSLSDGEPFYDEI